MGKGDYTNTIKQNLFWFNPCSKLACRSVIFKSESIFQKVMQLGIQSNNLYTLALIHNWPKILEMTFVTSTNVQLWVQTLEILIPLILKISSYQVRSNVNALLKLDHWYNTTVATTFEISCHLSYLHQYRAQNCTNNRL